MLDEHWKLWQDCLEEAEHKNFQPLREMVLIKHRYCTFLFPFLNIDLFRALSCITLCKINDPKLFCI